MPVDAKPEMMFVGENAFRNAGFMIEAMSYSDFLANMINHPVITLLAVIHFKGFEYTVIKWLKLTAGVGR